MPAVQAVDALIGNGQAQNASSFLHTLNEIAPDAAFDDLVKTSEPGEALDLYLRNSETSRREAFLAIREALGEKNVVATCGLTKRITNDGVVWILDNEAVKTAFGEGKTRDEARSLLADWNAKQAAAALETKAAKRSVFDNINILGNLKKLN